MRTPEEAQERYEAFMKDLMNGERCIVDLAHCHEIRVSHVEDLAEQAGLKLTRPYEDQPWIIIATPVENAQ